MVDRQYTEPRLAELYDAFCEGRLDLPFYLPLIMDAASVLDVGCGTGELLRLARTDGHIGRLVGLDPAEAMLDVARTHRSDIEWVPGDLASRSWLEEFELVVMTGHAFQVLLTDEEVRVALAAIRDALEFGGCFAFETRNPPFRGWGPGGRNEIVFNGEAISFLPGPAAIVGEYVSFQQIYRCPDWDRDEESFSTLRFMGPDALEAFLEEAGLEIEAQYGDWDRSPLTGASQEIITITRRR